MSETAEEALERINALTADIAEGRGDSYEISRVIAGIATDQMIEDATSERLYLIWMGLQDSE